MGGSIVTVRKGKSTWRQGLSWILAHDGVSEVVPLARFDGSNNGKGHRSDAHHGTQQNGCGDQENGQAQDDYGYDLEFSAVDANDNIIPLNFLSGATGITFTVWRTTPSGLLRMWQDNVSGNFTVVNASGGLKAKGHPIGTTGVSMLAELTKQLREEVKPNRQAPMKNYVALAHNTGGTGHYGYVTILRR